MDGLVGLEGFAKRVRFIVECWRVGLVPWSTGRVSVVLPISEAVARWQVRFQQRTSSF
jgi:hypothetical protein